MNKKKLTEIISQYRYRPCLACGKTPSDAVHVRLWGGVPVNTPRNLVPLCKAHHAEMHLSGWKAFLVRYPIAWNHLSSLGWRWHDSVLSNEEISAEILKLNWNKTSAQLLN